MRNGSLIPGYSIFNSVFTTKIGKLVIGIKCFTRLHLGPILWLYPLFWEKKISHETSKQIGMTLMEIKVFWVSSFRPKNQQRISASKRGWIKNFIIPNMLSNPISIIKCLYFFWFDLFLDGRAEILKNISLVFWSKRWHQKDILKLTDL